MPLRPIWPPVEVVDVVAVDARRLSLLNVGEPWPILDSVEEGVIEGRTLDEVVRLRLCCCTCCCG